VLTLSCQDTLGIVAAIANFLAEHQGNIIESAQYSDLESNCFFMRVVFEPQKTAPSFSHINKAFSKVAKQFAMEWHCHDLSQKPNVMLMVSKESHCLNDLLHRYASGCLPVEITSVVSNHTDLEHMAHWYEIPFFHLPINKKNKKDQEQTLLQLMQAQEIDLLVLARYMQVLSPNLVKQVAGRAINIHHSFLPSFKGANPYKQAFERGVKVIGATAHYVSNALDEGPIIAQEVIHVDHTSSPQDLKHSGRDIESTVLAKAVRYHAEHRVLLNGNKTVIF